MTEETKVDEKAGKSAGKQEQREADQIEKLKAKLFDLEKQNKVKDLQIESLKAEKKKPGIPVVEADGERSKRNRPDTNPWGVSTMMLPPFMKGRIATYRLVGLDEINPATGQPVLPFPGQIPGRYTLYDKFEKDPLKRDKVMTNIVGMERYIENGKSLVRENIDEVYFERGLLSVNIEKKYLFHCFLELHPMNKTNRHRPPGSGDAFERIDINLRSKAFESTKFDLGIDAVKEIEKMKAAEILAYAAAIKDIDTSIKRAPGEIARDLKKFALNNPQEFFKLNKNSREAVRLNMVEAQQYGLVVYDINTRNWVFAETEENICTHTANQDPTDELIRFLSSEEGQEWYDAIMQRLNYWEPQE